MSHGKQEKASPEPSCSLVDASPQLTPPAGSTTRPCTISPIFDAQSLKEPLASFEKSAFSQSYSSDGLLSTAAPSSCPASIPPKSAGSKDEYLLPTLASDEPLRLATLWYHVNGLHEDPAAMQSIRGKVALLKQLIDWEYAICGIVECDHFERIVTEGLPLAIVPRRESPCSHTVLQPAGAIFYLPNMMEDWRFQTSPCVGKLGLGAYAGTPLRVKARDSDQEVAIGTLCTASASSQHLSQAQLSILTSIAGMISADIANATKLRRMRQQQQNDSLLHDLNEKIGKGLTESMVIAAIEDVFPRAQCTLRPYIDGLIKLEPSDNMIFRNPDHPCQIWENQDAINDFIRHRNHEQSKLIVQPARAVVGCLSDDPAIRALVLSTCDISLIFDDIDLRFISSCTLLLNNIAKDKALQEALEAQKRFARGFTHHLRTPVHGILASIELMQSDLAAGILEGQPWRETSDSLIVGADMIQNSGKELMQFINSVIKYNDWFEPTDESERVSIIDADTIETHILQDIPLPLIQLRSRNTCVYFERKIPDDVALVVHNASLITECIQPILVNALQNTSHGSIVITCSASSDYSSIIFDVTDTGHGIATAEHQSIFDPYQKTDFDRKGSGLGLTLARRLAERFRGSVSLVRSQPDQGSHFRIILNEQNFACPLPTKPRPSPAVALDALPKRFCIINNGSLSGHIRCFTELLQAYGCEQTMSPIDALTIVPHTHDPEEYDVQLSKAVGARFACSLIPSQADVSVEQAKYPAVMFYTCPFTTARLLEIMSEINDICKEQTAALRDSTPVLTRTSSRTEPVSATTTLVRNSSLKKRDVASTISPTCLLVDDNVINLRILCMFCKQRNYPYRQAIDGAEAVEHYKAAYEEAPVRLILLDLQMPRCDGIEACKLIRSFEASRSAPRAVIIIITGQDNPADRRNATDAGADDYFVKPLALQKLDKVIQTHIQQHVA